MLPTASSNACTGSLLPAAASMPRELVIVAARSRSTQPARSAGHDLRCSVPAFSSSQNHDPGSDQAAHSCSNDVPRAWNTNGMSATRFCRLSTPCHPRQSARQQRCTVTGHALNATLQSTPSARPPGSGLWFGILCKSLFAILPMPDRQALQGSQAGCDGPK